MGQCSLETLLEEAGTGAVGAAAEPRVEAALTAGKRSLQEPEGSASYEIRTQLLGVLALHKTKGGLEMQCFLLFRGDH